MVSYVMCEMFIVDTSAVTTHDKTSQDEFVLKLIQKQLYKSQLLSLIVNSIHLCAVGLSNLLSVIFIIFNAINANVELIGN